MATEERVTYGRPLYVGCTRRAPGDGSGIDRPQGVDAWELHLTVEGCGAMLGAAGDRRVLPGDFLLLRPGAPHLYAADQGGLWYYYWVYFQPKARWQTMLTAWPEWFGGIARYRCVLSNAERLRQAFENLLALQNHPGARRLDLLANALERLLLLLDEEVSRSSGGSPDSRFDEVARYIAENYAQSWTIADLARLANLSPSRFAAVFKEQLGETPMRYLEGIRVEHASEWLLRTDLSVAEIAARAGFHCPFHFSRVFRRRTGMSPRHFRQSGGVRPPGQ